MKFKVVVVHDWRIASEESECSGRLDRSDGSLGNSLSAETIRLLQIQAKVLGLIVQFGECDSALPDARIYYYYADRSSKTAPLRAAPLQVVVCHAKVDSPCPDWADHLIEGRGEIGLLNCDNTRIIARHEGKL